jgi:hypothetical protein
MKDKMIIEIPFWVSHFNMLLYSSFYYCEKNNIVFEVKLNSALKNGILLNYKHISYFFDYSDDVVFTENNSNFDFYFKRSLLNESFSGNVFPLNFQVNYSYNSLAFFCKLKLDIILNKKSRIELIRAMDYFNLFTNLSHNAMDIRKIPKKINDNNGRILFQTRLWNPDNHPDFEEKERRKQQNDFRINACRLIKRKYKNAIIGLYPDDLSVRMANDILLEKKMTSKKMYLKNLINSDIANADDGLKDTPGWKIGEYVMYGKAIISTPINTVVESFNKNTNYLVLSSRNNYEEIIYKIEELLDNKNYLIQGLNNLEYTKKFLDPIAYIERIIDRK